MTNQPKSPVLYSEPLIIKLSNLEVICNQINNLLKGKNYRTFIETYDATILIEQIATLKSVDFWINDDCFGGINIHYSDRMSNSDAVAVWNIKVRDFIAFSEKGFCVLRNLEGNILIFEIEEE
jgi:hypothetical protein